MSALIQLPPDNKELSVKLPSLLHTQSTFIRPFIQLDIHDFEGFLKKPQFTSRLDMGKQTDVTRVFIETINSYKQYPFIMLAVCDRFTFQPIGALLVAATDQENELELIIEAPGSVAGEVVIEILENYNAYNITFITHQNLQAFRENGFQFDEERKVFVR